MCVQQDQNHGFALLYFNFFKKVRGAFFGYSVVITIVSELLVSGTGQYKELCGVGGVSE